MSYKWETKWTSPNYTPASRVQATWGRPRTIEAIAIHWWGDPKQNPSYEGVINYLLRPGGSSAHIVATGTGRRAACLVNLSDASWATNSANPYTISIECDPRARDSDYDVVAEVIAQLRSIYGNIPLVPHKQFVATACPGTYSLDRLNKIAATKQVSKSDAWGKVSNKVVTPPVTLKKKNTFSPAKTFKVNTNTTLVNIPANTKYAGSKTYKKGETIANVVELLEYSDGKSFYRTKYARDDAKKLYGFGKGKLTEVVPPKPTPAPTPKPVPEPEKPVEQPESPSKVGLDESSTTLLQDVKKLLEELTQLLKSIFKIGDK